MGIARISFLLFFIVLSDETSAQSSDLGRVSLKALQEKLSERVVEKENHGSLNLSRYRFRYDENGNSKVELRNQGWPSTDENFIKFNSNILIPTTVSEISCVGPEDDMGKILKELNWTSCYETRPRSFDEKLMDEKALLTNDMKVCSCLRKSKVSSVENIMNASMFQNKALTSNQEVMNKISSAISKDPKALQEEYSRTLSGLLLNASFISNSEEYFINAYGQPFQKFDEKKPALQVTDRKIALNMSFDPKPLIKEEFPLPAGQCISGTDFILRTQIYPYKQKDQLIKELKKPFVPDEWNFSKLKAQYNELLSSESEKSSEQFNSLKTRIRFLHKNPLLRYFFEAQDQELKDSNFKKNDLFTIMGNLTKKECQDLEQSCIDQYKKDLAPVFRNESVMALIRNKANEELNKKINKKLASSDYLTDISQQSVINEFQRAYNLPSPDSCEAQDLEKAEKCLYTFAAYCQTLDKYKIHIVGMPSDGLSASEKLDALLEDDFNPDIRTNEIFRKVNEEACNRKKGKKTASFEQFKDEFCKKKMVPECSLKSSNYYQFMTARFAVAYKESTSGSKDTQDLMKPAAVLDTDKLKKVVSTTDFNSGLDSQTAMRRSIQKERLTSALDQAFGVGGAGAGKKSESSSSMANDSSSIDNGSSITGSAEAVSASQNYAYSNSPIGHSSSSEPQKVEDMSNEKRSQLLNEWKDELEEIKKTPSSNIDPARAQAEASLQARINALEELLKDQRKLTEQQSKLLNDAIAAKTKTTKDEAQNDGPNTKNQADEIKATSAVSGNTVNNTVVRAPAAIQESVTQGASLGSKIPTPSGVTKSKTTSDNSADSVAREEAKLVNYRRMGDGTITIEAAISGSKMSGNAITVPVSDEQYRMLESNPGSLNLSSIEKNIPKDQIEKLNKTGEIVILLQNGSKPPFEVKVEKKNNKLVYRLKDKNGKPEIPIKRVFTREALQENLKVQR